MPRPRGGRRYPGASKSEKTLLAQVDAYAIAVAPMQKEPVVSSADLASRKLLRTLYTQLGQHVSSLA